MKFFALFLIGLGFGIGTAAQTLTRNELMDFGHRLQQLISEKDSIYDGTRPSQFIYVLADVGKEGTITRLEYSGVRRDTLFKMLSLLSPANFKDWKSSGSSGKTIVIPLFYLSGNTKADDPIYKMFQTHYGKIPHAEMITEVGNAIMVRWLLVQGLTRQTKK